MIPQRTLTAQCEISTGSFTTLQMPPMYTGEASALQVQVLLKNNGVNYTPPEGVSAEMYLYFPNTENMTLAYEMEITDNLLEGTLPASATGIDGYPLLIIQLIDTATGDLIVAAHYQVRMIKTRGKYIVSTEAPSPSEVVYIGKSPYVDTETGRWMEWDAQQNAFVDTGITAKGDKGDKGDAGSVTSVQGIAPDGQGNVQLTGEDTETGNPITVETDSAQIAKHTLLTFEPIQDLHGYDHPWPAGGGKNLLDESTIEIGSYLTDGTEFGNGDNIYRRININLPAGTYTVSTSLQNPYLIRILVNNVVDSNVSNTHLFPATFTLTSNANVKIAFRNTGTTEITESFNTQIETGSTATSYEPYSNVCPISGIDVAEIDRVGKNLIDKNTVTSGYRFNSTGTTTADESFSISDFIKVYAGTEYTVTHAFGVNPSICFYKENKEFLIGYKYNHNDSSLPLTIEAPSNASYARISIKNDKLNVMQFIKTSENTGEYNEYQASSVAVGLPETVYGGTLDLETGELIINKRTTTVSAQTWGYDSSNTRFYANISNIKAYATARTGFITSSAFIPITDGRALANVPNYGVCTATIQRLYVKCTDYSDPQDFVNVFANVQITYELASQVAYQISPAMLSLLKGANHVSTNTKTIALTFGEGQLATLEDLAREIQRVSTDKLDELTDSLEVNAALMTELMAILDAQE